MRRSARALPACSALLLTACAGHGFAGSRHPVDPSLLLGCGRAVSAEHGLTDVTQSTNELEARSVVDAAHAPAQGSAAYDALTITLAPAKQGLRLVVGGSSYVLRQLRGGGVGKSAGRTEWQNIEPSAEVARARDAVLARCGTLGG